MPEAAASAPDDEQAAAPASDPAPSSSAEAPSDEAAPEQEASDEADSGEVASDEAASEAKAPAATEPEPTASPATPHTAAPEAAAADTENTVAEEAEEEAGPRQWEDASDMLGIAAFGSIETCEALTLPLTLLPGVGSVLSSVFEWACLIPGAMSVDYTAIHHGQNESLIWQATSALIVAKLWREVMKYAGIAGAVGLVGVGVGLAVPTALQFIPALATLPAIPGYYLPVALAGVVTVGGASFIVWKKIRDVGTDWLFSGTYHLLSGDLTTPERREEAMKNAIVKWPPSGVNRAWALMATSAGTEPEREWHFYLPVVGAWNKAMARGEAVKASMRRVSTDVLAEGGKIRESALDEMDGMITTMAVIEGGLAASAQACLIAGGALFVGGTFAAALQYQSEEDLGTYAVVAGVTGGVGIAVATTGVGLLLAREVPKALRPLAAPAVYGLFPPDDPVE